MWLKQSTAVVVSFGPFVDQTDGVTLETGLVSALDHATTGIFLSKNGGALTIRHAAVTASTYDAYGNYRVTLDTTDTNTLGTLRMQFAAAASCLPVWQEFMVVTADAWDSMFGAVVIGQAGAQAALVANNLDHLCKTATAGVDMTAEVVDGSVISRMVSNSDTSLFVPATHSMQIVGADVAATHVHAAAADTQTVAATLGAAVWNDVASGHTGAGSFGLYLGGVPAGASLAADIIAMKADTAAILVDTATIDTAAEIAAAVWSADATSYQTQGTFGQAIGDPVADANTIFKAVVTDATGATVGADTAALITDVAATHAHAAAADLATVAATIQADCNAALVANNLDHISADTNGVIVAPASKTGYALSATGADLILKTSTFALAIADAVWDELITGATHGTATSAGKRLLNATALVISADTLPSQAGVATNQVKLATTEPDTAHILTQNLITITSGTGVGQTRLIVEYGGADSLCTLNRVWDVQPAIGDEYIITGFSSFMFTHHGVAVGGAAGTISLATTALAVNDAYIGSMVVITSGTGAGQARLVMDYAADGFLATISPNWTTTPDNTSVYVVLPVGRAIIDSISANSITAASIADGAIDNATFAADVGSTAYATNIIALAVRKVMDALNLDHLALTPTVGADMTAELADDTILARIIGNGDTSTFTPSTDGLHAAGVDLDAILADTTTIDTAGEIAAAVWSADATTYQAAGTFGQAIGDPGADATTIYQAVVTDAAGTHVAADIIAVKTDTAAILLDTAEIGVAGAGLTDLPTTDANVVSMANDVITAAAIDTGAIDANALAAAAVDEILDEVVEGTVTVRQALMVLLAAVSGKASGGGTATIKFRDSTDARDRITLTVDADGNRSASVLDVAAT